jgi:hypothetical protein
LIPDIEKFLLIAIFKMAATIPHKFNIVRFQRPEYLWNRTMLNFCGIVAAILKMETGKKFSMSGINSGRWNRTMLNLWIISTGRHFQNGRHNTAQIQHCPIIYQQMKCRWNQTMLNLCGIVVAILKMAAARKFSVGNKFGKS